MTAPPASTDPTVLVDGPAADGIAELAVVLQTTVARLNRVLRQQAPVGLGTGLVMALATIDRLGPLPVGQLAEEERVSAPTATKVADRLHRDGLVARTPDPSDRRVTLLSITPAGQAYLDERRSHKAAWLAAQLNRLTPEQQHLLDQATGLLNDLLTPPPPDSSAEPQITP